jgi:hypothetical protein
MGATVYASAQQRRYPQRKAINASGQPEQLNDPWTGGGTPQNTDDRLTIKDYIPLDAFLDPLSDKVNLDPSATRTSAKDPAENTPEPFVYSSFHLFYGWRYTDIPGQPGMVRLGDRFKWTAGPNGNLFRKQGSWTFDVLATDQNSVPNTFNGFIASHPDDKGVLRLDTLRNAPVVRGGTLGLGLDEGFYYVFSRWDIATPPEFRGKLDVNAAHSDGGVSRVSAVAWDEEEKVTSAPLAIDGPAGTTYFLNIPR